MKTTRALIERLHADSKLRRLCGFDLRFALPSESTFSRAFDEFADSELIQRVHARMIQDTLGEQLIGHLSRDSTAIEARESIAKKDKTEVVPAQPKNKRGRPSKGEVRAAPEPSPLERQRGQTLEQMLFELDTACATGTKKNAQGYKISWKGYKLHLDTACCGVPISAVLTGGQRARQPGRVAAHTHQRPARRCLLRTDGRRLLQHGDPRGNTGCGARAFD
ncbi:MAG: transposase [Rhodoferax sp.]|nr:transposase [Rhodoferax sp.]